MSFFKFDKSKVSKGGGLIEEGKYEVTITDAQPKKASTGKEMVVVTYEVRSDFEQKFQGWKLNYNNFILEEGNSFTNTLLDSCWGDEGPPDFRDVQDMCQRLLARNLVVSVVHEKYKNREGEEKTKGVAKYTDRSKVNPPEPQGPPIVVGDSDLPF